MKIEDLQHANVLARPESNNKNVSDGAYNGFIRLAEFVERDCQYSADGKRIVLNIKVEVIDEEGETVDLYIAPNYSWSKLGKMVKILEKLEVLPNPGESISLEELVDMPVLVIVENVEKDNVTYSNIKSIERTKQSTSKNAIIKKTLENANKPKISAHVEDDFDDLFD
ncbi:hypothetical protein [Lysinibacillus sp.]|uniref:hypothetical protein n=1 Tax=Lysinibacillus sp. TaxID=1869345 RepID=UPI00289AAB7E|nr:hypothetical protein [Lysinibacillus sp.]